MTHERGKQEEARYRKDEHNKACCILVSQTAKRLNLSLDIKDLREVFRLAFSLHGGHTEEELRDIFNEWVYAPHDTHLSEVVENFCIDILANRIHVLPQQRKAKKRKGGVE